MAGSSFSQARPLIVGANHRSSSLGLRDRLFVEDQELPDLFEQLRGAGLSQALIASTCDRVEILTIAENHDDAERKIVSCLAARSEIDSAELARQLYRYSDEEAVLHIFDVASSLDSQVMGEPQVLGQIKAAHRIARENGFVSSSLEALMQAAFETARRVRRETEIGKRPVSLAAAAVQTARDLHGDLGRCTGLIIGAGDMGALIAEALQAGGLTSLVVTHPTDSRADAVSRRLECTSAPFDELSKLMIEADIVLAAVGSRSHTLTADMVKTSLSMRRHKPVFIIDTSIPGDVQPSTDRIDEAFLYDVHDLEKVAEDGRSGREAEADEARRIVGEEVALFYKDKNERLAVPILVQLREMFEDSRVAVLDEAGGDAEKATRLLINRLLHTPSLMLKGAASEDGKEEAQGWETIENVLRQVFDLRPSAAKKNDIKENE
jgi:glutamyl-tRNA reductase